MNLIFILFCITSALVRNTVSEIWEFGRHAHESVVVADNRGTIEAPQKTTNLRVKVPNCYKIQYVRVEVVNPTSTPVVEFRSRVKTVVISYGPDQSSASSYHVLAEATRNGRCERNIFG